MRPGLHGFWGSGVAIDFKNGDFVDITGWTVLLQQVKLNRLSTIAGWPTPNDPTLPPRGSGDNTAGDNTGYNYSLDSASLPPGFAPPQQALRLYNNGNENLAYGVVHGPAVYSDETVHIQGGSTVEFWWRAFGSTDAYDVFGYLVNVDDGTSIILINETGPDQTGSKPWTLNTTTIPDGIAGDYKFVFIVGSYDFTGGKAYGASLYITGVKVKT
jgi:hypothetical protein